MVAEKRPTTRLSELSSPSALCSVAEAARLLGVSPSTVWRWVDSGKLPALRVGPKAIRIRRADLESAVRENSEGTATRPLRMMDRVYTSIEEALQPLTDEEREAMRLTWEIAERTSLRKKVPDDSADIIREAREERSRLA